LRTSPDRALRGARLRRRGESFPFPPPSTPLRGRHGLAYRTVCGCSRRAPCVAHGARLAARGGPVRRSPLPGAAPCCPGARAAMALGSRGPRPSRAACASAAARPPARPPLPACGVPGAARSAPGVALAGCVRRARRSLPTARPLPCSRRAAGARPARVPRSPPLASPWHGAVRAGPSVARPAHGAPGEARRARSRLCRASSARSPGVVVAWCPARSWHVASPPAQLARLRRRAPSCPIPALAVRFIVPLLSSLHNSVYVALVIAEVSFVYPGLLSVYLMRKSSNPVPNRVVVAPRLLSCSCRGRTHIRVCIACRRGLDDARLPVDDTRLPPRRVRAFAPFTRVVVAIRVRGLSASSPSVRATSRTRSAHTS
jgi:hypothetical protein